jgi:hypothetical protein
MSLEELDTVHLRHPVVRQDRRYRLAAQHQLAQRVQGVGTGLGPDDPVLLPVVPAQVTSHRTTHPGIVVHGHQDGFGHALPPDLACHHRK